MNSLEVTRTHFVPPQETPHEPAEENLLETIATDNAETLTLDTKVFWEIISRIGRSD